MFIQRLKKLLLTGQYPYKAFMHKHKCIFVHIPKNAGSSVLSVFNDTGARWHVSWLHYYRANQKAFKSYKKFAIVREPIERLYSTYSYCLQGGNQSTFDLSLQRQISNNSDDFESFIHNVLNTNLVLQHELFLPQYLYIYDRNLVCKIDNIIRYENLEVEWNKIAKANSFPEILPQVNAGPMSLHTLKGQVKSTLTESAITKIQDIYQQDFQLLNY